MWLYYRFSLSLRMVEELLPARGIELTYATVRRWAVKFGSGIARRIRPLTASAGRSKEHAWAATHCDEKGVCGVGRPARFLTGALADMRAYKGDGRRSG